MFLLYLSSNAKHLLPFYRTIIKKKGLRKNLITVFVALSVFQTTSVTLLGTVAAEIEHYLQKCIKLNFRKGQKFPSGIFQN